MSGAVLGAGDVGKVTRGALPPGTPRDILGQKKAGRVCQKKAGRVCQETVRR